MVRFIDLHRKKCGVEPICAVLPIAPSTYYETKARERDATRRPARAQRDTTLMPAIRRVWEATRWRYGAKKVWKELLREGVRVARCTVARLFKAMGLRGVLRRRRRRWAVVAEPRRIARRTSCSATSRRRARTSYGSRTSRTSRRGGASSTSPS
jgi:transposase InsO family protein